jgi:hypothetical protein
MKIATDPPGLVKREIVAQDDETVTFVETWDLTAPGCPMVAVSFAPFRLVDPIDDIYRRKVILSHIQYLNAFGPKR